MFEIFMHTLRSFFGTGVLKTSLIVSGVVILVVLAALGSRSALLVGFAIPTSFLLCFAFLAVMGVAVSNIVMFGLILAVGMLVDGAIVVVEYADRRIREGSGPMRAYVEAAKRMFWPIVSSTATTLISERSTRAWVRTKSIWGASVSAWRRARQEWAEARTPS